MAANLSFEVEICGNVTPHYQQVWAKYEYWCEGVLFSSLGLFGNIK